ncbi:rcc01693 family protein [Paenirhodobacter enshiensis]|uniref:rcc01693 family protein n=1 Tax=Paenirhodobacter enshiensis TaxID=1105367 RepID=UPI00068A2BBA|nr:rcc01693 family protein [Paenirhodobacter enshiensis]
MTGGSLDWPGLMRAGMRGLGLRPAEFWALTPAELALMLGVEASNPPLTRARLREMAARWPDRGTEPAPGADRDTATMEGGDDGSGRL